MILETPYGSKNFNIFNVSLLVYNIRKYKKKILENRNNTNSVIHTTHASTQIFHSHTDPKHFIYTYTKY